MDEGTGFFLGASGSSVDIRTISAASWLGSVGSFLLERLMQGTMTQDESKMKGVIISN